MTSSKKTKLLKELGIENKLPIVLIFGGSQGAQNTVHRKQLHIALCTYKVWRNLSEAGEVAVDIQQEAVVPVHINKVEHGR